MRIWLREKVERRFNQLLDVEVRDDYADETASETLTVNEMSDLSFRVYSDHLDTIEVRVIVGDVLVASTLKVDRADYDLEVPVDIDEKDGYLSCSGRLFRDWAGQTTVGIDVLQGELWERAFAAPVHVQTGKFAQTTFEDLCDQIANHSAALLLDIYGKTFLGIAPDRELGESAPVLALQRMQRAAKEIGDSLRAMAQRPAYHLKEDVVREPAIPGQPVSPHTLEEACVDPSMFQCCRAKPVAFVERVRLQSSQSFDRQENRVISGFIKFLECQLSDIRRRLDLEIRIRHERRPFRSTLKDGQSKTWWEETDLPRIGELQQLKQKADTLYRTLGSHLRHEFLPPSGVLDRLPSTTELTRHHPAYHRAFSAIRSHLRLYRIQLDDLHLLTRAKSLPVLYEYWCTLEILEIMSRHLCIKSMKSNQQRSPFHRFTEDRDRFVIEFDADQCVWFEDNAGRLLRLRYEPRYQRAAGNLLDEYGHLGTGWERTPDIAIEIFEASSDGSITPELIIIFDAKYSTESHEKKIGEVKERYGKIGTFADGRILSRQIWALVPSPPSRSIDELLDWTSFCTVDNVGFWSDSFDMNSTNAGAVQAKPWSGEGRSPLECLMLTILRRSGVALNSNCG